MDIPYVRKLTSPEDQKDFARLIGTAFVSSFDGEAFVPQTQQQLAETPETLYGYGTPVKSAMAIHAYDVWFDGVLTKATGVGGVASLPEAREHGGIRKIFETLLPDWYRDGVTFSILYPFSHEFYRKFGYEQVQKRYTYRIPFTSLKSLPHDRSARVVTDPAELETICEIFGRRNNLYIKRKGNQWHRVSRDPWKELNYTYAIGDDAFLSFIPKKSGEPGKGATMVVRDIAYRDENALRGLLGFLYAFRAQYDILELPLPPSVPMIDMLPECYDVSLSVTPRGMGRIVNVTRALRQMRYPARAGRFTVYVKDPQIPENTGVFRVNYADSKATSVLKLGDDPSEVRPEELAEVQFFTAPEPEKDTVPAGFLKTKEWDEDAEPLADYMTHTSSAAIGFLKDADDKKAKEAKEAQKKASEEAAGTEEKKPEDEVKNPIDLTCSIQVLTQLVVGTLSIDQAMYLPDVSCPHPAALRPVFTKKDIFFTDSF